VIHFRLFGIPVTVQPWFWLTAAFLGGAFRIKTSADLLEVGLFMLAAFISIMVHELGHALTIRHFRLPTEIVLQAFGGYAAYPAGVLNRPRSFLVTAAGPAIQVVLGAAALLVLIFVSLPPTHIQLFVYFLMWVSFAWAILNCFPIYPLDGGRMLESILGPRRQKLLFGIGFGTAVILGLFAILNSFLFLAIFMGLFAWTNYQHMSRAVS